MNKIKKYLNPSRSLPRRRLKFTPEQVALFESSFLNKGTNNSRGQKLKEEGVLALQHLELKKREEEARIRSRSERPHVLKREATLPEKLRGGKDEYELTTLVVGMSGADPLLSFYVGGVGLNGLGALAKTGLWNIAKYTPTTQLGNWGRGYFVGNAFKNSFNGTVPILTSQTTSLLYLPTKLNEAGLTSLKFFERKPARKPLSVAESLGIPRGDRGNLSLSQRQAIEDLALYRNSGQYRQVFRVTPDWEDFGWNLSRDNPTFMWQFAVDGKTMRGPWARVLLQTPTGKGVVSWNSERNMGGYSSKTFKLPLELKYSPGEANMMIDGPNQKIILTSPRVDIQDFMDDLASGTIEDLNLFKSLDSQLKRTIDKDVMKDFWVNSRKVQRPGSYMSGDNGEAPLGSTLIEAFKKKQLHKTPILETPIDLQTVRRTGLSPDSYSSIIRLGNRDGSLRWGEGFTNWNNSAIENKFVSDALTLLKNGKITPEQYEKIFNGWSLGIGGRPLLWITVEGLKIPVHPHPYIYAKKQGGKMNKIKKYLSPSGSLPKPNLFQRPDGNYFYSDDDGKTEINLTPLNKLTDNPAEWTYTDEAGRIYTPKREYKNTYTLTESNPIADYHNYLNLKDKSSRDRTLAKAYLNNGNVYDAFMAYMGMRAPKNPFEITGEPSIIPGRGVDPKTVQNVTKGIRTLEDYLRTTKVSAPRLEGTGHLRNNYATDRFLGGQIFESSLPEEAMRVQGHGMAKSPTILDALARLRYMLDNGFEKGKTFYTAPLKLSEEGKQFGAYLGTAGGTPYFDGHFLITGKPGLMINSVDDISTIYINDAYQNEEALKAALKLQQYLQKTYPKINFKLYSLGYKQGGKMNTLLFLKKYKI